MGPKIKDYFFSFLSIAVNIGCNLVMVPLYVKYFGTIDYGVWIIINTILQYLMLANFGLPTALTTIATNSSNPEDVIEVFRKSLNIMVSIASVLLGIIALLYFGRILPFEFFFGKTAQTQFYGTVLFLTIAFYLLRAPFQLGSSVFLILGKVALSKKYEIVNNLIIPASFVVTYYYKGNISFYSVCWSVLLVISSIVMYLHSRAYLFKTHQVKIASSTVKYPQIMKISMGYFAISMGALLVWNTDNLVIVNFLKVSDVTSYSLTFRIFTAFFSVLFTLNAILMPFYGKFNSNKDYDSIQKNFKNSLLLMTIIAGPLCLFIFLFSKEIFLIWTNNPVLYLGSNIFLFFGLYTIVLSCINSISVLLSALKKVRLLVIATFTEGIANLILSILLIRKFGVIGVSIGTLLGSLISLTLLCVFFKKEVGIPVKIPFGLLFRNVIMLTLTIILVFLTSFTFFNILIKGLAFLIFSLIYLAVNSKDIFSIIKIRNGKFA